MRDSPKEIDSPLLELSEEGLLMDLSYDDFSIDPTIDISSNDRKTIRYIRNDIKASIYISNILGRYSAKKTSLVIKLLDISSKGALISCPKRLRMRKKVKLVLAFKTNKTNKTFEISARVVRGETYDPQIYGVKFDVMNHKLGDYLLESQTTLILQEL
ncbi:MAG: PilZ domain-containing protein [Methylococcales bacterium]|nr:PilZ domain-containing protein [Methylococcales bacterium]